MKKKKKNRANPQYLNSHLSAVKSTDFGSKSEQKF